mmetsp:Transcript_6369/g.15852  ORF Transcript_6369/g.15852 Transcript_6369/m.15852 type:complete len:413 (-) Transcript_6369:371-1609(-)
MYSPSSGSSSDSISSVDSYRKRHRRPRISKGQKAQKRSDNSKCRYLTEAKKSSLPLTKHGLQRNGEKPRSYRKTYSSREDELTSREDQYISRDDELVVSRNELHEIKREHEKEIKNLMKFVEKESSLLNGIEEERREELNAIKLQHEKEVKKIFEFQRKELFIATEKHARKEAELEDRMERIQANASEELRRCKDHSLALEKELQSTTQKCQCEMKELNNEMSMTLRQTSLMENEIKTLNERLANKDIFIRQLEEANTEKDKYIRRLEGSNEKASYIEEQLRDEVRRRDDEIRRKDRAITRKKEEIRSINSRASPQEQEENTDHDGYEWEETSGLTSSSDFHVKKDPLKQYREKTPPKYGHPTSSSSKRLEHRDDLETKKISVSFSDEVEKRSPIQTYDNLSRRLEKMYLDR